MTPSAAIERELLLAGGGHAHLGVLRDLARRGPPPGVRVTLVAREAEPLYSGMLPGLVAGRFEPAECAVDLPRLARAAGARFIAAEACGLDCGARLFLLQGGRPPPRYDALSLNLGAAPALVPGAAEHALPLRPFDRFLERWEALLARAPRSACSRAGKRRCRATRRPRAASPLGRWRRPASSCTAMCRRSASIRSAKVPMASPTAIASPARGPAAARGSRRGRPPRTPERGCRAC